jgi:ATP-binding protein involved in chromosome partitioning
MNSNNITVEHVNQALHDVKDPETGRSIIRTKQLYGTVVGADSITLDIGLTSHSNPVRGLFVEEVEKVLRSRFPEIGTFQVRLHAHHRPVPEAGQVGLRCRSIIAVGSGKGGVGKSTIATSIALGLKRAGCRVGLLDADVYGPSIPNLIGVNGQPGRSGNKIAPIDANGMPVMSIGFMVPVDQAVIWRGPMLHSAVTQFLRDTDWGELDYLIIDMPPGTGDVALTLSQLMPATGAVVVCTPQKVALLDAIKALSMFEKVKIPVLGVVENMSSFVCPDNGKHYDIFGKGGAKRLAEQAGVPCLAEIPITMSMRIRGDEGRMDENFDDPAIRGELDSMVTRLVWELARRAAENPEIPALPVLT